MNILDAFPSTFLKSNDLKGKPVRVSMHSVELEEVGGEHKPVLYFANIDGSRKDRGLVLNKTNSSIIAELHGADTEEWSGKVITLYPARVEFQGRIVDAIRVQLTPGQAAAPQPRKITPPVDHHTRQAAQAPLPPSNGNGGHPVTDDEIPF